MEEFALLLIRLLIFVFVLTSMFAMGLSHAVKQLLDPEVDTAQVS